MNNTVREEDEIDLVDLFFYLMKRAWVIGTVLVLCLVLGFFGTKIIITPQYTASTRVYILNRSNENVVAYTDIQISTQFLKDYQELITGQNVTKEVVEKLGLDLTPAQLAKKISVSSPDGTRILQINVTDSSPRNAATIANKVQEVAAEQIQSIMDIDAVRLIYSADVPTAPSSPNALKNTLLAGLAGAALTVMLFVVIYLLDDTIRTEDDVARYLNLPVLGIIPISEELESQAGNNKKRKPKYASPKKA